jgi:hypothetical protein
MIDKISGKVAYADMSFGSFLARRQASPVAVVDPQIRLVQGGYDRPRPPALLLGLRGSLAMRASILR